MALLRAPHVNRVYLFSLEGIVRLIVVSLSTLLCFIVGLYSACQWESEDYVPCTSAFERPFFGTRELTGVVFLTGVTAATLLGSLLFFALHLLRWDKHVKILGESMWTTTCCLLMGVGSLWMTDVTMKGFSQGPLLNKYSQGLVASAIGFGITALYLLDSALLFIKYRPKESMEYTIIEQEEQCGRTML